MSVLTNPSETLAIRTGTGYTGADEANGIKAGAYVSAVSDEHMNRTYYTYDMVRGLTTKVENAKGVITKYDYYDEEDGKGHFDSLKSVSSSGSSVSYTYNKNNLSTIKYGTDTYSFTYDNFGNVLSTKINDKPLSTNTYGANNGVLEQTEYGNGAVRKYKYDSYGNLRIVENGNGTNLFSWHYDSSMTPMIHQDGVNDLHYNYSYDEIGRLIRQEIRTLDNVTHLGETEFTYDLRNNVTKIANEMGGRTLAQRYYYTAIDGIAETQRYAKENLPTRYLMSNDRYIDYSYDSLNRLNKKSLTTETPYVVGYSYKMSDRNEEGETLYRTTQISTEANGTTAYTYDYDVLGNITLIRKGVADGQGNKTGSSSGWRSYEYDNLNQLVRENNKTTNETYVYNYDNYGNITSKEIHSLLGTASEPSESTRKDTITYSYSTNGNAGWSKLLTKYGEETISYDSIGNPISYRGATLTWDGRELKKYVEGNTTVNYKYDADGLRSSKTVGNKTSTYQYVDGQLLYEDRNGNDIYYYYDSYGTPTAIVYCSASGSTNTVYIATNSLGDVIGLYDKNGTQIVKYEYDAWGKVVAETDANGNALTGSAKTWSEINPFRYRGYYYDSEVELYYLNSRFYDAETGRFINADDSSVITASQNSLTDKNLFSYCDDNPIVREDSAGEFWDTAFDVASLCVSVAEVMANPADPWAWAGLVGDTLDLVPFVTGVGELTKVAKVTVKSIENTDDVIKATRKLAKSDGIKKFTGSYEIMFESGRNYVGKGGLYRSTISARDKAKIYKDRVTSITWTPSSSVKNAFISEYNLMKKRGVNNDYTYNKIWSPGRKIVQSIWSALFGR